jgi:hypothetical protein
MEKGAFARAKAFALLLMKLHNAEKPNNIFTQIPDYGGAREK